MLAKAYFKSYLNLFFANQSSLFRCYTAKTKILLAPSKSMSAFGKHQASVAVTSVTGMQMMTPLGPASHQYKIRKMQAH
jgi:hypothetical protein